MQILRSRHRLFKVANSPEEDGRHSLSRSILIVSHLLVLTAFLVAPNRAEAVIRPVRDVQQALSAKGFDTGKPDGFWGVRSMAALRAFQKQNGLPETGVIDDNCLKLLLPAEQLPANVVTEQDVRSETVATSETRVASVQSPPPPAALAPQASSQKDTAASGSGIGLFWAIAIGIGAVVLLARRGKRQTKPRSR